MASGKAEIKYGFWVGIGLLAALLIWGIVSMLFGGALAGLKLGGG